MTYDRIDKLHTTNLSMLRGSSFLFTMTRCRVLGPLHLLALPLFLRLFLFVVVAPPLDLRTNFRYLRPLRLRPLRLLHNFLEVTVQPLPAVTSSNLRPRYTFSLSAKVCTSFVMHTCVGVNARLYIRYVY